MQVTRLQVSPASAANLADAAPVAIPSQPQATGATLSDLHLRFDGPVPIYMLPDHPTRAQTLRGYIKAERRALAEQQAQLERFLAEPVSDYRDAWLTSTRANIACSEKMLAAWGVELAQ